MECGNQEIQRREGVSNGVREDAEVRRGEKAGMEWTVIMQMGKRTQRRDKNHEQNQSEGKGEGTVRYGQGAMEERGQLDMVKERWKERLKWTKTQEKDQARGW